MDTAEAIEHVAQAWADSLDVEWDKTTDEERADFRAGASTAIAAHLGWLVQNGFNVIPPGAIPSPRSKGEAIAMHNAAKAYLRKPHLLNEGPRGSLIGITQ